MALFLITDDAFLHLTFPVTSSRFFPHVHTFFEAKMDAEQRYAITYLVRKKEN